MIISKIFMPTNCLYGLCLASVATIPFLAYWAKKRMFRIEVKNKQDKIMVITGCDSGIGLDLAQRMITEGFIVIATVIKEDSYGGKLLKDKGAVLQCVTYPIYEHIYSVLKLVEEYRVEGKKLHCLVNNAGIMIYGKYNWLTIDMIKNQIEVNLIGTLLMSRALVQSILYDDGRIVNISSAMGILASPYMSIYCATKAAIEATSCAMRREGVTVVIVRPGNLPLQTGIMHHSRDQLRTMKNVLNEKEFSGTVGTEIDAMLNHLDKMFQGITELPHHNIKDYYLIKCLRDSILLECPKRTYTALPFITRLFLNIFQILPHSVLDKLYRWNIPIAVLKMSETK